MGNPGEASTSSGPPAKVARSLSDDVFPQDIGLRPSFSRHPSHYIPNFQFLTYALATVDQKLRHVNWFKQRLSDEYFTHHSEIYYITICWYVVLKRMQREGLTTQDQNDFC